MNTSINELFGFLDYIVKKNYFTESGAGSRRTACKNLFSVLDENEQTVEYVSENLDQIVHRMNTKYRDKFTGQTVDVYKSRVKKTLDDYFAWTQDKSAWERGVVSRAKAASPKSKEAREQDSDRKAKVAPAAAEDKTTDAKTRRISFPIRPGFEVAVEIPLEGLTGAELQRLGYFLLPYCNDIPSDSWKELKWPMITQRGADAQNH